MNISIVVPVYNSSSIIEDLTKDILSTIKEISDVNKIQLILVNDCSTDESWKKISKLSDEYKDTVLGINLMKNYGQHNAIMAGLKLANGDYILFIDDDYQHPPKEIPKILSKIREGFDVCYTNYKNNTYSKYKIFGSWINKKISNILIDNPSDKRCGNLVYTYAYVLPPVVVIRSICTVGLKFTANDTCIPLPD